MLKIILIEAFKNTQDSYHNSLYIDYRTRRETTAQVDVDRVELAAASELSRVLAPHQPHDRTDEENYWYAAGYEDLNEEDGWEVFEIVWRKRYLIYDVSVSACFDFYTCQNWSHF